jgi:class 3 adenylate cyclase
VGRVIGLPGGVVTFVFTDIEGSTRLFRDLGDRYPPLLELHNSMLRDVWVAHRGAEAKTEGDAFFVAFGDPGDAVRACIEAFRCIDDHDWPEGARFRIRAGMHTGIAHPRDGDYIAFPVHQAARIGGVGHGGQVVVSPATAELADGLEGVHLHDLGSYRVRDFDESIHLYQAERAVEPTLHPALRTAADVMHNIPADVPDLIGRHDDLAGLKGQLAQSRLVSLLGPGGVGKTTLALNAGRRVVDRYTDGVWFVDLTAQLDLATVRGAIADALNVDVDGIAVARADKEMLVVLDNCEQAADAVARVVTDLMASTSSTSFLVTSREPLAIASEQIWRLQPFGGSASAVALFVARATAVDRDFDGDTHRDVIAEICRQLAFWPLESSGRTLWSFIAPLSRFWTRPVSS